MFNICALFYKVFSVQIKKATGIKHSSHDKFIIYIYVISNGSSRCGLYICCDNAIEKMKAEQEADVFNAVLMAKHRRPQFIPSLVCFLNVVIIIPFLTMEYLLNITLLSGQYFM